MSGTQTKPGYVLHNIRGVWTINHSLWLSLRVSVYTPPRPPRLINACQLICKPLFLHCLCCCTSFFHMAFDVSNDLYQIKITSNKWTHFMTDCCNDRESDSQLRIINISFTSTLITSTIEINATSVSSGTLHRVPKTSTFYFLNNSVNN